MLKGFIANLGKYNEGSLIGEWIEFPIDEDELEEVLARIGINEQYEEYFFTDWECEFDAGFDEFVSVDAVNEIAERLEKADVDVIKAIIEAQGCGLNAALDMEDDVIFYPNMTLEDVAYDIVQECYPLPEIVQRYFDYKAFARDLGFDGYTEVNNGVICIQ